MTYEFNIEDINEVQILDTQSNTHYTMIYKRAENDPDHRFIQEFSADIEVKDYNDETKTGTICFICPRCGDYSKESVAMEQHEDGLHIIGEPMFDCQYCEDDYIVYTSEDSIIEMIMDYFNNDEDIQITIDGKIIER